MVACVYVVKEHLGFYTEPTVAGMQEGEELNDFMWRVLTEEWKWERDRAKQLVEADKIRCFKLHSVFTKVWEALLSVMHDSDWIRRLTPQERCELHVRVCESLKIVEEPA